MAYDVFISYRRDGGGSDARMMYDRLLRAGFSVSFDMDTLKNGNFNEELLKRIAECKNFIVILSPGCFDRTFQEYKRENDWLRMEIAAALYNRKNIITVILPGFSFPDNLPPDISDIRNQNGPKYDLYYIDGFYDRLIKDFLVKDDIPKTGKVSKLESILAAVSEVSETETGIFDVLGDDTDFLRMESLKKYETVSRLMPYAELAELDREWHEAEKKREQGDWKNAATSYLKVIELCGKATPCSSPFALRMTADGIDTRKVDWFGKALVRAQSGDVDYEYGVGTIYAEGLGIAQNSAAAFRWLERAAQHGHLHAMGAIGAAYLSGNGVEADYPAAQKWLLKAADGGLSSAEERLGYLFYNGLGVEQDYSQARTWYERAAELNNSAACAALGGIYLQGDGIEADKDRAIEWFRKAAEDEHPGALRTLAELKFSEQNADGDYSEALNLCRRAMDGGDIEAICLLGQAYENGWGVEKNLEKAGELYEKAKSSGSVSAVKHLEEMLPETQYNLGLKYMEGREVPQDFALAREWFLKASNQGNVNAMAWYGHLLRLGAGGSLDIKTALSFFEKAAEGGSAVAMVELGRLYRNGSIVKKDLKPAKELYEKAICSWDKVPPECRWNVSAAFNNLGLMYEKGDGCTKDLLMAVRLYRFAAKADNIAGCKNLARMYRDGIGVSKSLEEMERWYSEMWRLAKSIHPCHGASMGTLGTACQAGEGCPRDLKAAAEWWRRGMRQMDYSSAVNLDNAGSEHPEILKTGDQAIILDFDRKLAESGNRVAMYNMGLNTRFGRLGIKADSKIAVEWYLKSAELGYGNAMRQLSNMYEEGEGVEQDREKGLEWIVKAAEADHVEAQRFLASRYRGGTSLGRDLGKSMKWLEKALKNAPEDVDSIRMMAVAYRDGIGVAENAVRAQELYASVIGKVSRWAEAQRAIWQADLADCYHYGWGVDVNLAKAADLFQKAACANNEYAMDELRRFYRYGVGMEPDRAQSDKWARCYLDAKFRDGGAASRGVADTCVTIGTHYICGFGVKPELDKAIFWFEKAAEKKSWSAMLQLFRIFHDGECCKPDSDKAEYWIQKALAELTPLAENGLGVAQNALAKCYSRGWGVEKSAEMAVKWFSEAYAVGNWNAATRLACCYAAGEGIAQDEAKALELLNRAVVRNNGPAQNRLGECHENGELGLPCDSGKAFELYRSAASNGNVGGLYNVGRCYAFGSGCEKSLDKAVMWLSLAAAEPSDSEDLDGYYRKAVELLDSLDNREK